MKPSFSKTLFWDTNVERLDFVKSKSYIIERIVTRGDFSDWKKMCSIYSAAEIKECITRIKDLDPKTLNFCSIYFEVPKEAFECYTKRHWTEAPTAF